MPKTPDRQLKRSASDFASFDEKTTPGSTDLLLIEDSADGGGKKRVQVGNLPGGGGSPGTILTNVTLSPWADNVVSHGLGQAYAGYYPVRRRGVVCDLHATLTGNRYAPIGWHILPLNGVKYDRGSNWDTTLGQMIAPVAGDYAISACIGWNLPPTNSELRIGLRMRSSPSVDLCHYQGMGDEVKTTRTWLPMDLSLPRIPIPKDTIVTLESYHNYSGGNPSIWALDYMTRLQVNLIDDGITESPTSNPTPETNIILRVSYKQVVDLLVF